MDTYVTGITIKTLREKKGLTQTELADILGVSSKAISKWETAKGLPDISLIEPLANALSVSVMELMTGNRALWLVITIVLMNFVGPILYFLLGKEDA